MFNQYNAETFTYHILLELCVIYVTMNVTTYFTFMILYVICMVGYMYIHITFKCDSHINNICYKHSLDP